MRTAHAGSQLGPAPCSDPDVCLRRPTQVREDAIRILRELRLLRLLEHPKIVAVEDVIMPSDKGTFEDVHIVFELFDTDLNQMIRSETKCAPLPPMARGPRTAFSLRACRRSHVCGCAAAAAAQV